MCLMVYVASGADLPCRRSDDLTIEDAGPAAAAVRRWLTLPMVRFVGAHTGCSCGFPSVSADEPVEYFDGMFAGHPDRDADLRSTHQLIALVREQVAAAGEVQLYAVWNGEEALEPKGTLTIVAGALDPDRFFFNERFLYRVTA